MVDNVTSAGGAAPAPKKARWWSRARTTIVKWWRLKAPPAFLLASATHWGDAGSWLAYTLFGGLLPFWGTALILLFIKRSQAFGGYFANGELAVFSAGLLASAIPVMRRRVKQAPVEHPGWFHFVALLSLAVIFILFASITLTRQFNLPAMGGPLPTLNEPAILATSIALFIVSVTMGFFVELIDNIRMTPAAVKALDDRREAHLDAAFEEAQRTVQQ